MTPSKVYVLFVVCALVASTFLITPASAASPLDHPCRLCRRLIGAIRSGPAGYKEGPLRLRLEVDTIRACSDLSYHGVINPATFAPCANITFLADILAANVSANTSSICQTVSANSD